MKTEKLSKQSISARHATAAVHLAWCSLNLWMILCNKLASTAERRISIS